MAHMLPLWEVKLLLFSDKDSAFEDCDAWEEDFDKNKSYPDEWLMLLEAFS